MNKKTVALFSLVFGCLAMVSSVAFAAYGTDNSISGKVYKKGSIKGINKATVKVYDETGDTLVESEKTNTKGKYACSDMEEATYVLKASANGYRNPSSKKATVTATVALDGDMVKNFTLAQGKAKK